MSRQTREKYH
uniref:Uncharacterized protein n=1 Tax=Arundo donax TaxID=35708 RepID=A0A0A9AZ74_ARUDO